MWTIVNQLYHANFLSRLVSQIKILTNIFCQFNKVTIFYTKTNIKRIIRLGCSILIWISYHNWIILFTFILHSIIIHLKNVCIDRAVLNWLVISTKLPFQICSAGFGSLPPGLLNIVQQRHEWKLFTRVRFSTKKPALIKILTENDKYLSTDLIFSALIIIRNFLSEFITY